MSDILSSDLFNIGVDVDDYASVAAEDTPSVPRTFQSEDAFRAQQVSYQAKIDDGNHLSELFTSIPDLQQPYLRLQQQGGEQPSSPAQDESPSRLPLTKKGFQLLSYAVAELYFCARFGDVVALTQAVLDSCLVDARARAALEKWRRRGREWLGEGREAD